MPKSPTLFFVIKSVNEATREVGGLITQQKTDKDGEVMDYLGSKPYFQQWSLEAFNSTTEAGQEASFGNVRVQHSKQAVGKFNVPLVFDDEVKSIWGQAKIYDDDTWDGVKGGVYTGFSVGGNLAGPIKKVGNQKLFTIMPREVSLVDNPAVDSAHFDYIRAADGVVVKTAFVHRTKAEATGNAILEILKVADFTAEEVTQVLTHVKDNVWDVTSNPDAVPGDRKQTSQPAEDNPDKSANPDLVTSNPDAVPGDRKATEQPAEDNQRVPNVMSATSNPDAVPDQSKETSQPVEDNHGKQPDPVVVVTPNQKSGSPFGDPDTQLGKHGGTPPADMIVKTVEDLKQSGWLPDNGEKVVKNKLSSPSVDTGANNMSKETLEIQKAARLGLTGHLQNLKQHADKCKAAVDGFHSAIHDACDKCMKLAGPAFDADSEHEGGQPSTGSGSAATETEVKAAKAEIEKLAAAVATLTASFNKQNEDKAAAEKLAVEKAAADKLAADKLAADAVEADKLAKEKAAKASVIGDPNKAAKVPPTAEKVAADKKEQEELLVLAKSAMGVGPNGTKTNQDPAAMDALYKKLTNATQYQAARKYMRAGN
jgi:hypothetical protein